MIRPGVSSERHNKSQYLSFFSHVTEKSTSCSPVWWPQTLLNTTVSKTFKITDKPPTWFNYLILEQITQRDDAFMGNMIDSTTDWLSKPLINDLKVRCQSSRGMATPPASPTLKWKRLYGFVGTWHLRHKNVSCCGNGMFRTCLVIAHRTKSFSVCPRIKVMDGLIVHKRYNEPVWQSQSSLGNSQKGAGWYQLHQPVRFKAAKWWRRGSSLIFLTPQLHCKNPTSVRMICAHKTYWRHS